MISFTTLFSVRTLCRTYRQESKEVKEERDIDFDWLVGWFGERCCVVALHQMTLNGLHLVLKAEFQKLSIYTNLRNCKKKVTFLNDMSTFK